MSQAATTVRPKPRPKPLPKATSSTVFATTSAPGTSYSANKITYDNVKDSDEMFMRNRGRGKDGWAKLRKISKETDQRKKKTVVVVDSDSDNSTPQPSNSKRKKEYDSPLKRPRWQTDKKFARLLSQDISDGGTDSDDSITIEDSGNANDGKLKRKRTEGSKRGRSKSITPPPAIPQYQLDHAKEVIRNTLGGDRQSSPDVEDDPEEEDSFVYDPQLAKIAQNVKSQSELLGHTSSSAEPNGGNDTVNITVRWEPHPLNEHGKRGTWGFKLDRTDNFSELFESVAEEANVLADKLVMAYRGNRFFSSVTPQTLNIWSDAEFVACDLPTYEYKRKIAAEQLRSEAAAKANKTTTDPPSNIIEIDSDEEDARIGPSSFMYNNDVDHSNASVALQTPVGDDQDEDKFKLVLRSALTSKDITLNVRSTTKCGAIVNAFLKKAGLMDKYPALSDGAADGSSLQKKTKSRRSVAGSTINKVPKLSIDGDKVGNDIEIGDYDLEEGDMVEVVDL
ncbi:hypothetical protein EV368DRAFT_81047 [Lentinula lateritia]|uniref:Uncharacterized protein n=1 Tax=Lentinula aff. lateritia TaxID=2804960 RepID=A0ACC1U064_9AGAR|nr:hypothetical protein F5876DRAFT_77102 [Lentinula aff. lateritia]KAJ3854001.1 hypothetical protein EV368DRAFT_81047 [Lentinula lateritia]